MESPRDGKIARPFAKRLNRCLLSHDFPPGKLSQEPANDVDGLMRYHQLVERHRLFFIGMLEKQGVAFPAVLFEVDGLEEPAGVIRLVTTVATIERSDRPVIGVKSAVPVYQPVN